MPPTSTPMPKGTGYATEQLRTQLNAKIFENDVLKTELARLAGDNEVLKLGKQYLERQNDDMKVEMAQLSRDLHQHKAMLQGMKMQTQLPSHPIHAEPFCGSSTFQDLKTIASSSWSTSRSSLASSSKPLGKRKQNDGNDSRPLKKPKPSTSQTSSRLPNSSVPPAFAERPPPPHLRKAKNAEKEDGEIVQGCALTGPPSAPNTPTTGTPPSTKGGEATNPQGQPQPKVDIEGTALCFSPSIVQAYLRGAPNLSISPRPLKGDICRYVLRSLYKTSLHSWIGYLPPETNPSGPMKRNLWFLSAKENIVVPKLPGESGLVFGCNDHEEDLASNRPWTVFRQRGRMWKYLGEYENTHMGNLSKEQFCQQTLKVQSSWARCYSKGHRSKHFEVKARIALRKAGALPVDDKELERTLVAEQVANLRRGKEFSLSESEVVEAFRRGEEGIGVLRMRCVDYDHTFIRHVERTYRAWKDEVKKVEVKQKVVKTQEQPPGNTNEAPPMPTSSTTSVSKAATVSVPPLHGNPTTSTLRHPRNPSAPVHRAVAPTSNVPGSALIPPPAPRAPTAAFGRLLYGDASTPNSVTSPMAHSLLPPSLLPHSSYANVIRPAISYPTSTVPLSKADNQPVEYDSPSSVSPVEPAQASTSTLTSSSANSVTVPEHTAVVTPRIHRSHQATQPASFTLLASSASECMASSVPAASAESLASLSLRALWSNPLDGESEGEGEMYREDDSDGALSDASELEYL